MDTTAIILNKPRDLCLDALSMHAPGAGDLVVDVHYSGISTGTEKLLWTGEMPPFPGMGYPLVPGYESAGRVVEAARDSGYRPDDWIFVPGANCFDGARCLFGGAAQRIVTSADRVTRVDAGLGADSVLLALAATARHTVAGLGHDVPELIVGHGVLGRLLARLTIASGAPAPTVWEIAPGRMEGATNYLVVSPEDDPRHDYRVICDASGNAGLLDTLVGRLAKGGEIVLAGFYAQAISLSFPPAFMKEARLRIAAEWTRDDLQATRELVEAGALSLSGLITHRAPAAAAADAYRTVTSDLDCLKMVLDWRAQA